ncbi:N protein [Xiburema virus]|uniref:Nucleoprotein n=1 Tax=Xiburema virus TaxID=1272959 RepID=A0A059TZZ5_9RHAB|nr:N protein [Xiburema virus]AHZ45718.1 N protein [Xiburema virus]
MFCTISKKSFKPVLPRELSVPQYPKAFFEARQGKPILQIPQKGVDIKTIRGLIKGGITLNKLDVKLVIRYVYEILKEEKGTLTQKWESFGNVIGNQGSDVKIFQMFEIEEVEEKLADGQENQTATEEDDEWMVMWILFQYRMARTVHAEHRTLIANKLTMVLQGVYPQAPAIPSKTTTTANWLGNLNFTKMIAGIDMFFHMFKQHPLSNLRMGTLPSRYKDCSALLGLSQMADVTSMDENEIADWIFVGAVGKDVMNLMEPDQEIDDPNSYTPYLMDMGLSNKSPYSATQCPAFYNFCHITCTLLHSTRSKHARLINENNMSDIKANARIVAYVVGENLNLMKVFLKDEQDKVLTHEELMGERGLEDDMSVDFDPNAVVPMPETRNALDWYNYLVRTDCKLPQLVIEKTQGLARRIGNTRDGTIGKFVETTMA